MSRRFPQFFEGETVVWKKTFYSDIEKLNPVDPSTVVFKLESPSGNIFSPTIINEPGTGNFSSSYVMSEYGNWDWRWITTGPNIADQGTIVIIQKNIA